MATSNNEIESRLWANSDLRPSEYSTTVLGMIFFLEGQIAENVTLLLEMDS